MKIVVRLPSLDFRQILIRLLFYFAVGCLLASLATAPGQIYLGKFYYIKDAGVVLSYLALAALAMVRNDKLAMLVAAAATALIVIFIPALPKDESMATGLNIMWIMKWSVAAQLGILTYRERLFRPMTIALAVLVTILCVDGLVGLWEIRGQHYFFDASDAEETATGAAITRQEAFLDLIRIHGVHRSSGDFGNAMAVGLICATFLALTCEKKALRIAMAPLICLFAYDSFFSTLRSFLVGGTAGAIAVLCGMLLRRWFSRYFVAVIAILIGACLFFSYFNIIPVVEFVSKHFLNGFDIGSVNSSYERLDSWDDVYSDIRAAPIVVLIGGPLASALSADAPPSNICDNIYLWVFYHLGIFGLVTFLLTIPLPLATRTDQRVRVFYFGAATQLLVTGIFTDSLLYFSSLTLFFALGLIVAEWDSYKWPKFGVTQPYGNEPQPEVTMSMADAEEVQ